VQFARINDIAIHAIDCIPWMTGLKITTVDAARNWNAALKQVPHFRDAAMLMPSGAHCGSWRASAALNESLRSEPTIVITFTLAMFQILEFFPRRLGPL